VQNQKNLCLLWLGGCVSSLTLAQDTSENLPIAVVQNMTRLQEITVSSVTPGIEQNIQDVQASIEVIDRERINALSLRSVPQLLQYAVGVDMRDRGSTSGFTVRGSAEGQTLLLVDGLRRTGKFGNSDLIGLSVENIERIEIIRGPMSALYGADSIGGVVNIITRKPGKNSGGGAYLMGGATGQGERGSIIGRMFLESGEFYGTRHRVSFEARERDRFRFNRQASHTDLNDLSQKFLAYNGDWQIQNGKRLSWAMEHTNQDDENIRFGGTRGFEKEDRSQGRLHYNDANETRVIDLSLGYGVSDTAVVRSGSNVPETTNFQRMEGNAFVTFFPLKNLTWTMGAGGRDESVNVNVFTGGRQTRTVYHGMTQAEYNLSGAWGRFSLLGGLRYDSFSDFGGSLNPRVSGTYGYDAFSLRASYGQGFTAPSFTSQFITIERTASRPGFISTSLIFGNPQLKAENGETFEISGAYRFKRGQLDVTYHRTNYKDLILSQSVGQIFRNGIPVCTAGRTQTPGELPRTLSCFDTLNVGKALIDGVEVVLNYQVFDWWRLFTSYEYLKTRDKATGLRLSNRAADHTVRVQSLFNYQDKLLFNINMISQWDLFGQNAVRQNVFVDHFNMDIKLDYFLTSQLNVFAGIDNLTNRKPADGFSGISRALDPGARFFYGGMAVRF